MKRKKILICCILAALLTIFTIIPTLAWNALPTRPNDLGERIYDLNNLPNGFYYIRVTTEEVITGDIFKFTVNTPTNNTYDYAIISQYTEDLTSLSYVDNLGEVVLVRLLNYSTSVTLPYYVVTRNAKYDYYIGFAIASRANYFVSLELINNNYNIELYVCGPTGIDYEYAYLQGYTSGYNIGFNEGQNIQQYTNLVGYVEQLIGQFTGTSAAQYITPIAIVLVVLFVYFLFIRFLLSLVKAKGIIKTCDIIMIVACIIMLVVMYAPMLDLTIKTEQINSSEETTEAVQINRSNIYVETTETGDIYYGPVGTAIVTKSETIENIYKISEDIETEAIAYEKD